jgi:hypothetical protein
MLLSELSMISKGGNHGELYSAILEVAWVA